MYVYKSTGVATNNWVVERINCQSYETVTSINIPERVSLLNRALRYEGHSVVVL